MPRKFPRRTLAKGIYRDGDRIELRLVVAGQTFSEWLPADTGLDECRKRWKQLQGRAQGDRHAPTKGTLNGDAARYLKLQTHLTSYRSKVAILRHWCDLFGSRPRHRITREDVLASRVSWLKAKVQPKTVNHRVAVLRHLYRTLGGSKSDTPCDDVPLLPVPKTPIRRVTNEQILAVDAQLQQLERRPGKEGRKFDGAKTRARFRVLVSTGRRPSEVMRAQPSDVDLQARVWVVRDGKGGWSPGLYLNDDMLAAWRLFAEANAWGYFNISSFGLTVKRAGWPADVRLYNARHSTWIEAVERGADMADVQEGAGHKNLATTRQYTGVRHSRMQSLSERLDGRFGGFPLVPPSIPSGK